MADYDKTKEQLVDELRILRQKLRDAESIKMALQVNKANFQRVIENDVDGIVIVDAEGVMRFSNPAAEVFLGHSKEELMGTQFGFPLIEGKNMEIEIVRRDAGTRAGEINVVEIEWVGKNAYFVSIRDVTERKKLEKLKDDFISTVSHELFTPLTPITTATELLLDKRVGRLSDKQKHLVSILDRNVKRFAKLIKELLDFSRLKRGGFKLFRKPVHIEDILKMIQDEFELEASKKELNFSVNVREQLPLIFADTDSVQQVLINLLSNALKFTSQGYVHVYAYLEKDEVICCVEDTGIGMRQEDMSMLFEKFQQFSRSDGSGYKGTGLGLAVCREIVGLHNGRIWAESEMDKGSKFYFSLPVFEYELHLKESFEDMVSALEEGSRLTLLLLTLDISETCKDGRQNAKRNCTVSIEDLISRSLHPEDFILPLDTEFIIMLFNADKEAADKVKERLLDNFSKKAVRCAMRFGVSVYPDDAEDIEKLIYKARRNISA